ncbi:MAG: FtsK/SpoIIIE domain-containing protein [Kineosporiaceae bacterium]
MLVEAEPDTPWWRVRDELEAVHGPLPAPFAAIDGEAPLAHAAPASGSVAVEEEPDPSHAPVLVGRGGRLAGRRWPLPEAPSWSIGIGRDPGNDVVLADPSVSRWHARLGRRPDGTLWVQPVDGRPVALEGAPVPAAGAAVVGSQAVIQLGSTLVGLAEQSPDDGDVSVRDGGVVEFNRPARIRSHRREPRIAAPAAPPVAADPTGLPWAMALGPALIAVVSASVMHAPLMLLTALTSPVVLAAGHLGQRRAARRRLARARLEWRRSRDEAHAEVAAAAEQERQAARRQLPDPATLHDVCTRRRARLWERRGEDSDALHVRVGVCRRGVSATFLGPEQPVRPPVAAPVPLHVDLREAGVLGVAGPREEVLDLGRWVAVQLLALRSPRDLRLVVVCPDDADADWGWVSWAPHVRPEDPAGPAVSLGTTPRTRAARVREVAAEVERRRAELGRSGRAWSGPELVLVVDGARELRALPGMALVLRDGPAVGVHAVCLDSERVRLPEEAGAQVILTGPGRANWQHRGHEDVEDVVPDGVGADVALECARALAPVEHIGGDGDPRRLPATARLADVVGIDPCDVDAVRAAWVAAGPRARATVGVGADGPLTLDLVAEGPHVLVAGTTGSGKSEFLQTLVTSLALQAPPDALAFVLVDYKGASAFAECADLPHTVGLVTNLDHRGTERALASLQAEIERRERFLAGLGAKDLATAWAQDPAAAAGALPRLVIVVDEFAELAVDLPDFVTGLIRVARVGRSLGVHLVLATQRPTGVISAEMQANVSLRVGLRTADRENSLEVLGVPDAASISPRTPGRGLVAVAGGGPPRSFQTARVAVPAPGAAGLGSPVRVHRLEWSGLGEPLAPVAPARALGPTDLSAWVASCSQAALRQGLVKVPAPWLPPLPERLGLTQVPPADDPRLLRIGLLDRPEAQHQGAWGISWSAGEHLAVVGSSRSGRSTLARTVVAEIARQSADDVHLHVIDAGGGGLAVARGLPHCGAVVEGHEAGRAVRLLRRAVTDLERRQRALSAHGHGDLGELRACALGEGSPCGDLPACVIVVDRWEGLVAALGPEDAQVAREALGRLLREGAAVGYLLVVTGDRSLLTERVAGLFRHTLLLRQTDREDYRLAGIRPGALPLEIPPGRAYARDTAVELQVAVVGGDPSAAAQVQHLRELVDASVVGDAQARHRPWRVDPLPVRVPLADARRLPAAAGSASPGAGEPVVLVGVGGDELAAHHLDAGAGLVVVGGRGTGRSSALVTLAAQLADAGFSVTQVRAGRTPLSGAGAGTQAVGTSAHSGHDGGAGRPMAFVIDDAEGLLGSELEAELVDLAGRGVPVIVAVGPEAVLAPRGLVAVLLRSRAALLLSPSAPHEGTPWGTPVPRELLGRGVPGRAVVLQAGEWRPVQVPLVGEQA